jgi:hypothetical protein
LGKKNKITTDNENVIRLVNALGNQEMTSKQLMAAVNLKNRENFVEYSLEPAIKTGYVRMLYPESPRHPRQKYLLTVKGQMLFNMKKINAQ